MQSISDISGTDETGLVRSLRTEVAQLQQALTSRIVIEQAKGVLAERWQMHVDEAFDVLRRASRHHRLNLHELAQQVVDSPLTPIQLEAALVSHRHGRS
jgi:AmiR/NasT family two-component response regulator